MSDLSKFRSEFPLSHKLLRAAWGVVWAVLFRPSPRICFAWRRGLLRLFGARIGRGVRVYGSARIFYPPNLEMGDHAVLGPDTDCYCVGPVRIGAGAMVSQYAYLCGATHDYRYARLPLVAGAIVIGDKAWVCADAFIGPGVTVGEGAVVGARSGVYKDVADWTVVAGNPARKIKDRVMVDGSGPKS